jgi:hypothetical protein
MTAVNIPDMREIIKEHGLVAVPFDLNLETAAPESIDEFKRKITKKVRSNLSYSRLDLLCLVCIPLRHNL